MFAVKGWAVDASTLKPQTEPFKSSEKGDVPELQDGEKASRKRKREINSATAPEGDIGAKWEQHIEGKPKQKGNKKDRKKQKKEQEAAEDVNGFAAAQKNKADEQKATKHEEAADAAAEPKLEKKNKRRKPGHRENQAQDGAPAATLAPTSNAAATIPPPAPPVPANSKLTPMQAAMRQKLVSARFRHLNETLYTAPSVDAEHLFISNPSMFEDYHAGFRQQVSVWPENPLDNFINTIRSRGKVKQTFNKKGAKPTPTDSNALTSLPRTHGTAIIADLGCGDARLASTLTSSNETSSLNLKLHSFDLHSPSRFVTKADISSLPLEKDSCDLALFCLALMGTNWISFIEEAYRILHWRGELWVAEIKSRFGRVEKKGKPVEHSVGSKRKAAALAKKNEQKAKENEEVNEQQVLATEVDGVETQQQETDVSAFVDVLRRRGFVLKDGEKSVDLSNKMFVKMEFIKAAAPTKGKGKKGEPEDGKPKFSKKKFVDEKAEEEPATDDEAKVLKPCLYKIR